MVETLRRDDGEPAESVFVYGQDQHATGMLAVGFALRRHELFSWADCAISEEGVSSRTRELFSRGRSRKAGDGVAPSDLTVPRWSGASLDGVLVPESRADSLHLLSYLALPSLLQELAAMSIVPSGASSVVLTNIDALEHDLRASVFARAELHQRVHDARISLFVTSGERPTRGEALAFDLILRLDGTDGVTWPDASVYVEKAYRSVKDAGPISLRTAWQVFGLDPKLLP